MEDKKIIELFLKRSESGIGELSKKYGKICMNTAYNIVGNHEDAEECVNDSYLWVWNAVPPHVPNPLLTFLLRIVKNISINRYTYNNRKKRYTSTYTKCINEMEYCLEDYELVEDIVEAKELAKHIESFLDTLSKTNRMLFIRRYWYIDSYELLFQKTGLKEQAIRTRLTRVRQSLKKFLYERGVLV